MTKGKTVLKGDDDKGLDFKEMPQVGHILEETYRNGDKMVTHRYRFLAAFTGKARNLMAKTRDYGTYNNYGKVGGKDAMFLWADIGDSTYTPVKDPDMDELIIKVPKAIALKIRACAEENKRSLEQQVSTELTDIYTVNY